jgi:hypothetical protein
MSSFFGGVGGDSPCEGDRPSPEIAVPPRIGVGELHELCLWGFPAGRTVKVQIRAPDGRVERRDVCYWCREASNSILWGSAPGDPLGVYQVTMTQGATELATEFGVERQHAPLLRVVGSVAENGRAHPIRAGATVPIILAGFPANSLVRLDIYFVPSAVPLEAKYITTLPVRTDANGQRLYKQGTDTGDEGCYVLRTRPPIDFHAVAGVIDSIETFCLA